MDDFDTCESFKEEDDVAFICGHLQSLIESKSDFEGLKQTISNLNEEYLKLEVEGEKIPICQQ